MARLTRSPVEKQVGKVGKVGKVGQVVKMKKKKENVGKARRIHNAQ